MIDRRGTVFVATSVVMCAVFTYRAIGDQRVANLEVVRTASGAADICASSATRRGR